MPTVSVSTLLLGLNLICVNFNRSSKGAPTIGEWSSAWPLPSLCLRATSELRLKRSENSLKNVSQTKSNLSQWTAITSKPRSCSSNSCTSPWEAPAASCARGVFEPSSGMALASPWLASIVPFCWLGWFSQSQKGAVVASFPWIQMRRLTMDDVWPGKFCGSQV